ncbi:MAG: hypothetical protein QGH11_06245, partial [Pirellulaceae bacterium]|nr:hypothetical protein [Pirellulaceae bacterium]
MVRSIFTIPLGAISEEPLAGGAGADEARTGPAEIPARAPRQYVGSDENRLVEAAINTLFASNHIDGRATPDSINPLVFFGPGGSGKSLLVFGVATRWQSQYPSDEVVQLTGVDLLHRLAEAIQVILRKSGRHNAYEQLKKLTRGVNIDSKAIGKFVDGLD